MRNVVKILAVLSFVLFTSCGKNEAVRPVGSYGNPNMPPPTQAPPPPGGGFPGYPGGPGGMPPGGGYPGYTGGQFPPQVPPQMPPQFYPFMPVYYVLPPPVFVNVWVNWQQAAPSYGCGVYDFSCFWYDYCGGSFGGYYPETYAAVNNYYYSWMTPGMSFDHYADGGYFWGNYSCGDCYY